MPRYCSRPGCRTVVVSGICEAHKRAAQQAYDSQRPNSYRRGYGSTRWRNLRAQQLAKQPLCETCLAADRYVPAVHVDHRVPHDGPSDPKYSDPANLSSLCHRCHSRKTATQDGGFRGKRTTA